MSLSYITNNWTERLTKAVREINTDHAYIHDGIGFKASLDIGALAAAATESYAFTTPSKYFHFKNLSLSSVGATVKAELIRGTAANPLDVASGTTTVTELTGPHNVNDNSATASGATFVKTPVYTGTEDGETWDVIIAPGSATNQYQSVVQTQMGDNFEYVMKPDSDYVIKFTNMSPGGGDAASNVKMDMFWYEEDDG